MNRFLTAALMGLFGIAVFTSFAEAANPPARMGDPVKPLDVNYIRKADNAIELDVGAGRNRYGETVNNATFDTEDGWMPSFAVSGTALLTSKKYSFLNDLYLNLDGGVTSGNSTYDGGLQFSNGTTIPYNNQTTHTSIYTLSGQIGHAFFVTDNFVVIPLLDLGFRYWDRNFKGTGGYQENYRHGQILGGALLQFSPFQKWVFSLTGEVGSTFGGGLNLPDYGLNFDLGSTTIWKAKAKAGYFFTDKLEATATVQFDGFGYGQSQKINGAYEPDSYTHEITTLIGVGYHL
jgi:hypothetical protein